MAFYHILMHKSRSSELTLLFKNLSEQELYTPVLFRFLSNANSVPEPDSSHADVIRVSIIRTERTHNREVNAYLRTCWQQAEDFMRTTGQYVNVNVNAQSPGDSAIAGVGKDVTDEILTAKTRSKLTKRIRDSPDQAQPARNNKVSLDELLRILTLIASPPNLRHEPQPGDRQDRHFDAWFDGGAIVMPTGGMSEYLFEDGTRVAWAGLAPRLAITIKWPDGRAVTLNQGADLSDSAKVVPLATGKDVPTQLGHYDITGVLGRGARGVVYEGFDRTSRNRVAIKTVPKNAFDTHGVARLDHPNIVRVLDFGEEADIAYIVMEFIEGRELKSFFDANERFEIKEAVRIMCELCNALHFMHEAGVIHRDIKPANVMIEAHGRIKLTDFGEACFTNADIDKNDSEKTGAMIGTPAYMSPEAITGAEIDRRTDIFSAGIILYQLLTGERLFSGPSVWTTVQMILEDDPPPPSSINKTISPLFDAVVSKALAKKAENRYQTAHDLSLALQAALAGHD